MHVHLAAYDLTGQTADQEFSVPDDPWELRVFAAAGMQKAGRAFARPASDMRLSSGSQPFIYRQGRTKMAVTPSRSRWISPLMMGFTESPPITSMPSSFTDQVSR